MPIRSPFRRAVSRLVIPCLAVACVSCSYLRAATGIGFQRPTLSFESWAPEQLDLEGVTIALRWRLDNPNDFGIDLRELDYRLEVEGQQVADGKLPAALELAAHGATPVSLPIRLRWHDIPNFVGLLLTRDDVAYRVTGSAGVGSALGTVMLPFEHRDRLALPRGAR